MLWKLRLLHLIAGRRHLLLTVQGGWWGAGQGLLEGLLRLWLATSSSKGCGGRDVSLRLLLLLLQLWWLCVGATTMLSQHCRGLLEVGGNWWGRHASRVEAPKLVGVARGWGLVGGLLWRSGSGVEVAVRWCGRGTWVVRRWRDGIERRGWVVLHLGWEGEGLSWVMQRQGLQ